MATTLLHNLLGLMIVTSVFIFLPDDVFAQTVTSLGTEPIQQQTQQPAGFDLQFIDPSMLFVVGLVIGLLVMLMLIGPIGAKVGFGEKMNKTLVIDLARDRTARLRMVQTWKGWYIDEDHVDFIGPSDVFKIGRLHISLKVVGRVDAVNPFGGAFLRQFMKKHNIGNVRQLIMQIRAEYLAQILQHRLDPQRERDFVNLLADIKKDIYRLFNATVIDTEGNEVEDLTATSPFDAKEGAVPRARLVIAKLNQMFDEMVRSIASDDPRNKSGNTALLFKPKEVNVRDVMKETWKHPESGEVTRFTKKEAEIIIRKRNEIRERLSDMLLQDPQLDHEAVMWWSAQHNGEQVIDYDVKVKCPKCGETQTVNPTIELSNGLFGWGVPISSIEMVEALEGKISEQSWRVLEDKVWLGVAALAAHANPDVGSGKKMSKKMIGILIIAIIGIVAAAFIFTANPIGPIPGIG